MSQMRQEKKNLIPRWSRVVSYLLSGFTLALIVYFIWVRLRLSLVRYFDMDEFLYLNWVYHMLQGYRPYVDFMLFVTPLFNVFLMPLFIFYKGLDPVISARILAGLIGVLNAFVLGYLFWEVKKNWTAITAVAVLLLLPMPSDKYLEIRPDGLAQLLFLFGLTLQVKWMKGKTNFAYFVGLFYALALLTLQKFLPQILVASSFAVFYTFGKVFKKKQSFKYFYYFVLGFVLPWFLFIFWAIATGDLQQVLYSVTKLPTEAVKGSFPLPVLFYFYPNNTYYGEWGYSLGYIVNLLFWIFGLLLACVKFVLASIGKIANAAQELLLASLCLLSVFLYVWVLPLKYPQYLMPVSLFVAWYIADYLYVFWRVLSRKRTGLLIFTSLYLTFIVLSSKTYQAVNVPKLNFTNSMHLTKMQKIYDTIPTNEYLLDLEGRTIYYPYPYFVCCLSFGTFQNYLSRPLPSLAQSLARTKTKYIYQAEINRIASLSSGDRAYIEENYVAVENGELYIRKD